MPEQNIQWQREGMVKVCAQERTHEAFFQTGEKVRRQRVRQPALCGAAAAPSGR
jgi:hypothetical protein